MAIVRNQDVVWLYVCVHYVKVRQNLEYLSKLVDQESEQIEIRFKRNIKWLVLDMIYTFAFIEFPLHVEEMLSKRMRAHFVHKPVVFGVVDVIQQFGNKLYPWKLRGIHRIAYFAVGILRKEHLAKFILHSRCSVY